MKITPQHRRALELRDQHLEPRQIATRIQLEFGGMYTTGQVIKMLEEMSHLEGLQALSSRPKPSREPGGSYRCGFHIVYGASVFEDRPGVYRISNGLKSNIIGEKFFEEIYADTDRDFVEFARTAVSDSFPHPFDPYGVPE